MPRIEAIRVLPGLWIAWEQNDYGERSHQSLGFTENHASHRVVERALREWSQQ